MAHKLNSSEMNTSEKMSSCLQYIDERLENTSEQTIKIAEMIIDDIKTLTKSYPSALKNNDLRGYADNVRNTQMKWVNQLHQIILEQSDRELNEQVIRTLQKFINTMNQTQMKHLHFDLPSEMAQYQTPSKPAEGVHTYVATANLNHLLTHPIKPETRTHH